MRDEIIDICLSALRNAGHEGATRESIWTDPAERAEFLELLRACRPLPVVRELIAELESKLREMRMGP